MTIDPEGFRSPADLVVSLIACNHSHRLRLLTTQQHQLQGSGCNFVSTISSSFQAVSGNITAKNLAAKNLLGLLP